MDEIADRYDRLAADFAATIDAVPDDCWSSPSPCTEWTARDIVAHVVESHGTFEKLVGRDMGAVPSVDDDPAASFAAANQVVGRQLRDPDAAGASFEGKVFGHTTFAEAIDRFISFDLLVHRWDLARAAGLDVTLPADEVARVHEAATRFDDAMRGPNAFGPEVPAPDGADEQTRLLAFLGRQV